MMPEDKIIRHIDQKGYFATDKKVLIALSGGQDSMALLDLLYRHQDHWELDLGLAHVNHQQRPESAQEEAALKELAQAYELPLYVSHFQGNFSEARARDFRYAFFEKLMAEQGYELLLTAHHKDDQAETILMRLMRGGRLKHLAGISDSQPFGPGRLVRPFLPFGKSELPQVAHFEDTSNQSLTYFRNRVRHTHLPAWEEENPQARDWLVHYGQEIADLYGLLDQLVDPSQTRQLAYFQAQKPALQGYLLATYLEDFPDLAMSKAQFDDLLRQINNSKNYHSPLKAGYFLRKDQTHFELTKIGPKTDSTLTPRVLKYQQTLLLEGFCLQFGEDSGDGLALTSLAPIQIRHRQAGDHLDFGAFSKKIRRLFIDEKIPQEARQKALVLEQEGHVLALLVAGRIYLRKSPNNGIIKGKLKIDQLETE